MTSLYKALEGGHLQVVALLLSKGAEVDSRDKVSTYNNVMYCVIVIIQSVCSVSNQLIRRKSNPISSPVKLPYRRHTSLNTTSR